jgi:hypothetical protein
MLLLNSYVAINYTHSPSIQHCQASFDDQLALHTLSKVYLEYRDTYDKSTAFRMVPNPEVAHGYLVRHQKGRGDFCWSGHAFRVHAAVEKGGYRCECR